MNILNHLVGTLPCNHGMNLNCKIRPVFANIFIDKTKSTSHCIVCLLGEEQVKITKRSLQRQVSDEALKNVQAKTRIDSNH